MSATTTSADKTRAKTSSTSMIQKPTAAKMLLQNFNHFSSSLIVASRGACKSGSGTQSRVDEALMITMNRSRDIHRIASEMEDKLKGYEGGNAKRALEHFAQTQPCFAFKKLKTDDDNEKKPDVKTISVIDIDDD
mmetsp:Transcript_24060/g.36103  ORF Transcript_24060/g.36103 Transcript_24060/m.36103 type:complete len:135 (-) Transcript_24060:374-778(-)